jgi:hypothetical protein
MRRTSILTFGCLLALSIVIGQLLTRTTAGQVEAPASRIPGRFQMTGTIGGVIVVDTTSGHCWINQDKETWEDLGSPAEPKKK